MSNTSESFVSSMRALCADEVRLRELGLLLPVEELVSPILAVLDDLLQDWPLRTSRSPS
jgi:hypothetical protein